MQRLHSSPQLPSLEIAAYDAANGAVPLAAAMSSQTVMVRSVLMRSPTVPSGGGSGRHLRQSLVAAPGAGKGTLVPWGRAQKYWTSG